MLPFLYDWISADRLHDMILCCCEANTEALSSKRFHSIALAKIEAIQAMWRKESQAFGNRYNSMSLNQAFGDSTTPASEWLNADNSGPDSLFYELEQAGCWDE